MVWGPESSASLNWLEAQLGVTFMQVQRESLEEMYDSNFVVRSDGQVVIEPLRACLYYRTGGGKTITALAAVRMQRYKAAVVIAPPSTKKSWEDVAARLDMTIIVMSHAKFRMKDTLLSRSIPVIVDEFHLLGGHTGKGWTKLDRLAKGLTAPLLLLSATPNYNDAERVYCIKHILAPDLRGGYLAFINANCETEVNPFSQTPDVTGFKYYQSAEDYLKNQPKVYYLPDNVQFTIVDVPVSTPMAPGFDDLGYDARTHKVMASGIERKHKFIQNSLIGEDGRIRPHIWDATWDLFPKQRPFVLVYANHSTVAEAFAQVLFEKGWKHAVVTGDTTSKRKDAYIEAFREGKLDVLVGTASLATGTDGLDKVCDHLVILDDTEDDSLRRQLIGRIMPRGTSVDASRKRVYRLLLS